MSSFYVECIGAEKFQNAEQMLADVPGGMERALKSATKRAVSFLRTQSTKEIRQRYDISRKNIRVEQNIRVNYRYFNGVEARVSFRGNKIPLWRYGGSSQSSPGSSGHCRGRPSARFNFADHVLPRVRCTDEIRAYRHFRADRRQDGDWRRGDQGNHGFVCPADARQRRCSGKPR